MFYYHGETLHFVLLHFGVLFRVVIVIIEVESIYQQSVCLKFFFQLHN